MRIVDLWRFFFLRLVGFSLVAEFENVTRRFSKGQTQFCDRDRLRGSRVAGDLEMLRLDSCARSIPSMIQAGKAIAEQRRSRRDRWMGARRDPMTGRVC